MSYIEIEKEIISRISNLFPAIRIYKDSYSNENENYILIDNEEVYDSSEYKRLVFDIKKNLLLINGISGLFFSYIDSQDELSQNAIKLYTPTEERYSVEADVQEIFVGSAISAKIDAIDKMYKYNSNIDYKAENLGSYIIGVNITWVNNHLAEAA